MFSACATGAEQSPIDLAGARRAELAPVEFHYRRTRVAIENTGNTIRVNPDRDSGIVLDGARYDLQQFHFHHGSEHTVDGVRLALKMPCNRSGGMFSSAADPGGVRSTGPWMEWR